MRNYINNISNTNSLKEYIEDKTPYLKKELKKYSRNIKGKVVKIKLKESINLLDKLTDNGDKKLVDDKIVVSFMRYYELLKELKK